ncbi:MAG: 2,3-diaminopropionate biosynthesis protein SbnB [Proteobacteria bacterium]|nr:2,3-diaminopropionate biosynthesis protein SbnB [Pseudomonadota bacterium]
MTSSLLVLTATDVRSLLSGCERDVIRAVEAAYITHDRGKSSLPQASRLGFADNPVDRILAIPAYIDDGGGLACVKWIASVPANTQRGLDRAHALIILNQRATGRPVAVLEGSIISAQRTAASAAAAAKRLHHGVRPSAFGFIGCGLINFEIARFLGAVWPETMRFIAFDIEPSRSLAFCERIGQIAPGAQCHAADRLQDVLAEAPLVSFATTEIRPHVSEIKPDNSKHSADWTKHGAGQVILHISLRDLCPAIIINNINLVDDATHVCTSATSLHLAEQTCGHRDFIACTLGSLLSGRSSLPRDTHKAKIFSPFGLGLLDLAVARLALARATERGLGQEIGEMLPVPWRMS